MKIVSFLTESIITGNPEGVSTIGPVHYDQKNGLGSVPDNANINYFGFACLMTQTMFSKLAANRDFGDSSSLDYIIENLKAGNAIGSPFLEILFDHDSTPKVRNHEGRTRAYAIQQLYGDVPILVHCFIGGGQRARHITLKQIKLFQKACYAEKSKIIVGPNCNDSVYFLSKWQSI